MADSTVDFLRARPRTRDAYRYILRTIRSRRLGPGDRLPTQEELCRNGPFWHNTLSAAMQILVREGVLTRRKGVGTVVVDPRANRESIYTVGVTYPRMTIGGYSSTLVFFIKCFLQQHDCDERTYVATCDTVVDGNALGPEEIFPGLADDLTGRLDAVLSTVVVTPPADPVFVSAGSTACPLSVSSDAADWTCRAVGHLVARGCKRLALVNGTAPTEKRFPQVEGFEAARRSGAALPDPIVLGNLGRIDGGCDAADRLLALPESSRPDGVVVANDMLCMGLTGRLAACGGDYRPQVAVSMSKQLPMMFALPVWRWETDLEEMARLSVDLTLSALDQVAPPEPCHKKIVPVLKGETAEL